MFAPKPPPSEAEAEAKVDRLHRNFGRLAIELDWFTKSNDLNGRKAQDDLSGASEGTEGASVPTAGLPPSASHHYSKPRSATDLRHMRVIDEAYLNCLFCVESPQMPRRLSRQR